MTEIKEPVYATERERIREAYCEMADKANYRPAAPGDGFGDIGLTEDELNDHNRLAVESAQYADQFLREENSLQFRVGISNWDTNRALVYSIEAARLLCCGFQDTRAVKLLQMAIAEVESQGRK